MGREERKPDFFIVGAPKAGTTALATYLGQHPDIFMAYRKEMHYFGKDLTKIPHEFYVLDEERYLSMFADARPDQKVGEASVNYLLSATAAEEIREFNPQARIIIMLRNPVDVLYSHHSQIYWGTYEEIADFEEALAAEPERKQGRNIPRCAMIRETLYYRELVRFSEQVQRYLDVFGREAVHIILFDDFCNDLAGVYRDTLAFLGVKPLELPDFKVVNPNKVTRFRPLMRMIQRPPLPMRAALRLLPDKRRYWFLGKLSRLNSRIEARPKLRPGLRAELIEEFAPEVAALGQVIGRDLSHWSRQAT